MTSLNLDSLIVAIADAVVERLQSRPLQPRLLNVSDAATYLGRSPKAIRGMIERGTLPAIRLDSHIQLDVADLDKLIRSSRMYNG